MAYPCLTARGSLLEALAASCLLFAAVNLIRTSPAFDVGYKQYGHVRSTSGMLLAANFTATGPEKATIPSKGVCSVFSRPPPTATSLWADHLADVLNASNGGGGGEGGGPPGRHDEFIASLLRIVSPHRLQRSVGTTPRDWEPVRRAAGVAHRRWEHVRRVNARGGVWRDGVGHGDAALTPNDEDEPRKLLVLVMGGSVTAGVRCDQLLSADPGRKFFNDFRTQKECSWPRRLELLLNRVLGGDVVEVHNAAVRGTDSEIGRTILEFDLLPPRLSNPDIIINSFSTNDAKGDRKREKVEGFVRWVMKGNDCEGHAPLLIHFDDYLGTKDDGVLGMGQLSKEVTFLANHYGFASISYSNALRDIVLGDPDEFWFSPNGWCDRRKRCVEIHPQVGMHIASSWIVGFNLLNLVTIYCSLEPTLKQWGSELAPSMETLSLPQLREGNVLPPGKPKPVPLGLPPETGNSLSIKRASEEWRQQSLPEHRRNVNRCGTNNVKRCILSWASSINDEGNKIALADKFWAPHIVQNEGWKFIDDHQKLGLVPVGGVGSTLTLDFPNATQPLNMVLLMVMKSYGERWYNSTTLVNVYIIQGNGLVQLDAVNITGYHERNTSISNPTSIPLVEGVKEGAGLRLEVVFVGGLTAKVMGLAVCT